jgi:CheY-like chemotaxis protein
MATIILADDDPFLTKIYSTRLSNDGHEVITCADGQTAVDSIKDNEPDLIILDIMLPRLNGLDVLTMVRQDKSLKDIPVVILSNLTHPEEQKEANKRGATAFLPKVKYTPSQVVAALQPYLPKATKKSDK